MDAGDCGKTETNVGNVDFVHPELLNRETLIYILKERQIKKDFNSLSKPELLELYNQYILPLPQRVYGHGRRETRLANNRNKDQKRQFEECNVNDNDLNSKRARMSERLSRSNVTELTPIERKLSNLNCKMDTCPPSKNLQLQNNKLKDSQRDKVMEPMELSPNRKARQPITWP